MLNLISKFVNKMVTLNKWTIGKDRSGNWYVEAEGEETIYCPQGEDEAKRLCDNLNGN
jgi:hypothetical protein